MKSHASDLLDLAVAIYTDCAAKCTVNSPDFERDLVTLRSRVESEGVSFLTITLPSIGAGLDRSLSNGFLEPTRFRSFGKRGKAPAFLQGFFAQVFDTGTGGIHERPSTQAIICIRQIAYAFKKLGLQCSPAREVAAIRQFVECEADFLVPLHPEDHREFLAVSRCLWGQVFSSENLSLDELIPKHGPGATAEKVSGNQKFYFGRWHDRLEPFFPLLYNAFSSESAYGSKEFEAVTIVNEEQEQPVRVITVPKTLKSPRIIAIEPVCMQYAQQALSRKLVGVLESSTLTGGHINFSDQSINRSLALFASERGALATLDLSAASDRVPRSLALQMFDSVPDFRDAIDSCRSKQARLPSGQIIGLKKFAAMGSALCFPVEAMYFYTLCVMALLRRRELPVTWPNLKTVGSLVYVYGDDIIVPADDAVTVSETLHKYYCRVNTDKSFWVGKFRESCGMDAFSGVPVTPTYIRRVKPRNRQSTQSIISWIATANLFAKRGFELTSRHMFNSCATIIGKLPSVGIDSAALGEIVDDGSYSVGRFSKRLHQPEVQAWTVSPLKEGDPLDGYPALLKCLLKLETSPFNPLSVDRKLVVAFTGPLLSSTEMIRKKIIARWARTVKIEDTSDEEHLDYSVRRGAVTLKSRWVRPY